MTRNPMNRALRNIQAIFDAIGPVTGTQLGRTVLDRDYEKALERTDAVLRRRGYMADDEQWQAYADALNEREAGGEPSEPMSDVQYPPLDPIPTTPEWLQNGGYLRRMREPRVVESLGPGEQDAQWRAAWGAHWKWENGRWWRADTPGMWIATPRGYTPNATGPYTETTAQSLSWRGWAVPAINEVLAGHDPFELRNNGTGITCDCSCGHQLIESWIDHVAPLIADRIACDPSRALAALQKETS